MSIIKDPRSVRQGCLRLAAGFLGHYQILKRQGTGAVQNLADRSTVHGKIFDGLRAAQGDGYWLRVLGLAIWCFLVSMAQAQVRPYIGYAYPAGGQQGTTFQVRLGGQNLDRIHAVYVTGSGVTAKVTDYYRRLNNQDMQLLSEQLRELKRGTTAVASAMAPGMISESPMMMSAANSEKTSALVENQEATTNFIAKIENRTRLFVQRPACASISSLVFVEVAIAPDAEPGEREIRVATFRGVSNPLKIYVGQVREYSRKPMKTASLQVLGKEAQALRKRPADEIEEQVTLPCTVNGQIASGEINRYRFEARRGQRLVISTLGRQLVPFIADAVPGWFQPVITLYDPDHREAAYGDDYRFKPDPVVFYEVPKDGQYTLAVHDSLYRGREDFVYRVTIGELPFVTGIFPLGGRVGQLPVITLDGWNLETAVWKSPATNAETGIHYIIANCQGVMANPVPFSLDTLPECLEKETNGNAAHVQKVALPVIINGRIEAPGDWDEFEFIGRSNDWIVAEVYARRLDSPLDSIIKLTDARGAVIVSNDDHEDPGSGLNTHHADSYIMTKLPADGAYRLCLGDAARQGGSAYAYRLRLSDPRPDFELRVVPSSISLRSRNNNALSVYAIRKDGFSGPIKLGLKDAPTGFSCASVTISGTKSMARLSVKTGLAMIKEPVDLTVVGYAKMGSREIVREAIPAEDRMQAFLWRHLVPAHDLKVLVFNPSYEPPPKRVARARAPSSMAANSLIASNAIATTNTLAATNAASASVGSAGGKPKFTRQQIAGRLRELKRLFEEGLLTDDFYEKKVAECESMP